MQLKSIASHLVSDPHVHHHHPLRVPVKSHQSLCLRMSSIPTKELMVEAINFRGTTASLFLYTSIGHQLSYQTNFKDLSSNILLNSKPTFFLEQASRRLLHITTSGFMGMFHTI